MYCSSYLPFQCSIFQLLNTDLKVREQQNSTVVHAVEAAVKIPRFEGVEDDLRSCDSVFSVGEGVNDLLEKELEEINEKDEEEDVCANGHNISLYDPSQNNYSIEYYDSLWGSITCVKVNCKNKGKTFGELMKKKYQSTCLQDVCNIRWAS